MEIAIGNKFQIQFCPSSHSGFKVWHHVQGARSLSVSQPCSGCPITSTAAKVSSSLQFMVSQAAVSNKRVAKI